jgi:hypothetical protein
MSHNVLEWFQPSFDQVAATGADLLDGKIFLEHSQQVDVVRYRMGHIGLPGTFGRHRHRATALLVEVMAKSVANLDDVGRT